MEGVLVNPAFWRNKRVFLTGHTGFKGSWLSLWLQQMGAVVRGYALEPQTEPSLFNIANVEKGMDSVIGDIRDIQRISKCMSDFDPDVVFHLAAQPLVRYSYIDPVETYETNVMGTLHVLEAARKCKGLKALVAVTTDKCYENKEWHWGYRENEPMGGHDPYSSSKGACELLISSYRRSFFNQRFSSAIASVRAGNVIGGGDWSEDRLIPDILLAFEKGHPVTIRNPLSTRPWQHVLEPLSGYLILAENLFVGGSKFAEAWNFGPRDEGCQSVEWILNKMLRIWGEDAKWELDQEANPHEAAFLKLDISKATNRLKWQPKWQLDQTLERIVDWHKGWLNGEDMRERCLNEIKDYLK